MIKVDPVLLKEGDMVFAKFGLTVEAAVALFIRQAVSTQSNPLAPESREDVFRRALANAPRAGRTDENGHLILPADWNDPEDDVYEQFF